MNQEFRLKKVDEIRNISKCQKHKSKKYKKVCKVLNYTEHSLILISTITGCVSISAFPSLAIILIGNTSSAIGLKMCVINTGIKKYKWIIKKKGWWNSTFSKI